MGKITFVDNCLFEGLVTHKRFKPFRHSFKYKVTYFWFDIFKIKNLFFFKLNKTSLFSFFDKDHGPIKENKNLFTYFQKELKKFFVNDVVFIKAMCLPRIIGYVFNPISVFVCFNKKRKASAVIFEVSNTFRERHAYLCRIKKNSNNYFLINKKFYVSSFFKVEGNYKIKFSIDRSLLHLFIIYEIKDQKVFEASFTGNSKDMTEFNLLKVFFFRAIQNIKVTFSIYIQALKLFTKGAKYVKRPRKNRKFFSFIK